MIRVSTTALALLLVTSACSSGAEGDGAGGSGGASSSASTSSAAPATTSGEPSGTGGDPSGTGGDPSGTGGDATSAGGAPATCGDDICTADERCKACDEEDESENHTSECWPTVAPEGSFVCGAGTCAAYGQYCQNRNDPYDQCFGHTCGDLNPECASDDLCSCLVDPCDGPDGVHSCEVGPDGAVNVVCQGY